MGLAAVVVWLGSLAAMAVRQFFPDLPLCRQVIQHGVCWAAFPHPHLPCLQHLPQMLSMPCCPTLQVIQHGACLGLGVAGLGTCDEEAFEDVKNVLYMDNAGACCS